MTAKLWGVGVGPGAADLMTLRAVEVLRRADAIAIPRRSEWDRSLSWRTAEPVVGDVPGQERLFLNFPMTKDPAVLRPAWDTAFGEIGARLEAGRSVAFVCQGDPLLYSTFVYLLSEAPGRWPGVEIEVVPGVTSISAVAAATVEPIADGAERVAILPATYGTDDLRRVLRDFDTVVLMKVSSVMPAVVEALEAEGLLDRAVYVSKATTPEERIVEDVREMRNDKCDYFSMVVVRKGARRGVLVG